MAASVMSLPPPERSLSILFLGSQRCCMVLGKESPIPFKALFMALLFIPASDMEGAAASTTGARSLTSSSFMSGSVISEIAVVRKVC